MKILALIAVILFSGSVSASCDMPMDHVEQRKCSEHLFNELSHKVISAQQSLRNKITTWDQEPEFKAAALANLDKAVHAFQTYQSEQCEFDASVAAGGNAANDLRIECKIRLYSSYLKYIQEQILSFK